MMDGMPGKTIMAVQHKLNMLGYRAGPVDGLIGPQTRAALRMYQHRRNLSADGVLSPGLAEMILGE
jgi:peptidoglycan hydrolase-like protein with peptidoglycan-binding domain